MGRSSRGFKHPVGMTKTRHYLANDSLLALLVLLHRLKVEVDKSKWAKDLSYVSRHTGVGKKWWVDDEE